jgi:hypothetical protein
MGDPNDYDEEGVMFAPRQPRPPRWTQKNVYLSNQDIEEQNRGMRNSFDRFINRDYRYISSNRLPKRQDEPEELDEFFDVIDTRDIPQTKKQVRDMLLGKIEEGKHIDSANTRHDVRKIHPDFHTYTKSVNISTGYQGAGKTFKALEEALSVVLYTTNTTHLIFIHKKHYDPTFQNVKELFELQGCMVIELTYDEAEKFVMAFLNAKYIYNIVRRVINEREHSREIPYDRDIMSLSDEDVEGALDMLGLADFRTYDWLNTIIMFDDVGNSQQFKNPDSYFNNRLKLCRDDNVIYYLTIHGITQLSPSIKANTAVVYVFKGLSQERLGVIYRQLNLPIEFGIFKGQYSLLGKIAGARCLVVDNIAGDDPSVE